MINFLAGKIVEIAKPVIVMIALLINLTPTPIQEVESLMVNIEEAKIELEAIKKIEIHIPEEKIIEEEIISVTKDSIACYCSRWAQENGVDIPDADAWDLYASSTPQVGGGVLFKYGDNIDEHHIAKTLWLLEYGMWVREANKIPCQITERFVSYNDESIIGFVPPKNNEHNL